MARTRTSLASDASAVELQRHAERIETNRLTARVLLPRQIGVDVAVLPDAELHPDASREPRDRVVLRVVVRLEGPVRPRVVSPRVREEALQMHPLSKAPVVLAVDPSDLHARSLDQAP